MTPFTLWAGFFLLVFFMLALDLGVFNRKNHVVGTQEALIWTAVWVSISLLFNVLIFFIYDRNWFAIQQSGSGLAGRDAALQFLTGYLIEKSLSLDNIFVIALIFQYFHIPAKYQHRVLFWGILGALIMRGAMIAAGAALITRFSWMVYIFGGFLLITAAKMLMSKQESIHPENNILVRWVRKIYQVTPDLDGAHFFTKVNGKRAVTPLFVVLLVVESSDVIFAVDSIPAIFAVTQEPFIVFTSNIFAILGLRSLYFALASLMSKFKYLKESLVFILAYVGAKMIAAHHFHIPAAFSLLIIIGILAVGIAASIWSAHNEDAPPADA